MSIKLIIDSASDISKKEAEKLNITILPLEVRFKDEVFYDGDTLTPLEFYNKLIETSELPKTSQINPYRFKEKYEEVVQNGDEAIVITMSSKLSGTYMSAVQAAEEFGGKIIVVDSLNACVGERLLIEYAVSLINEKEDIKEIVNLLEEKKHKINVLAVLDTLKYLKMGGRISSLVAFSGELFSIKPVVSIINGEVKLVGKARGSKNSSNLLIQLVQKKGIDFKMPFGVAYSGFDNKALQKYIIDNNALWEKETKEIPEYIIGCTIGTHIGPGAIGVAFFEKEK